MVTEIGINWTWALPLDRIENYEWNVKESLAAYTLVIQISFYINVAYL